MNLYDLHTSPETLHLQDEDPWQHIVEVFWPNRWTSNPKKFTEKQLAAVARDSTRSLWYAEIIGKPFPAGEPAIAADAYNAVTYARYCLRDKFPLGEPVIASRLSSAMQYASQFGPFPLAEKLIATSDRYSLEYAEGVLKGPFPAGEAAIGENAVLAWRYAWKVLKGRFPAGEKTILASSYADHYRERFLTG